MIKSSRYLVHLHCPSALTLSSAGITAIVRQPLDPGSTLVIVLRPLALIPRQEMTAIATVCDDVTANSKQAETRACCDHRVQEDSLLGPDNAMEYCHNHKLNLNI